MVTVSATATITFALASVFVAGVTRLRLPAYTLMALAGMCFAVLAGAVLRSIAQ
jgi:hypothetical protein